MCWPPAGGWHPEAGTSLKIRQALVAHHGRWEDATSAPAFQATCAFFGESLKRPPRGFDSDHPLIEHIKRKDFGVMVAFSEDAACQPDFPERFAGFCETAAPFVRFLTQVLDLPWKWRVYLQTRRIPWPSSR